MLDPSSAQYDTGFVGAVEAEIDNRLKRGKSAKDIDFLYDSAAVVKATNPKWARKLEEQAHEQQRQYNNSQNNFAIRGKSKADSWKPNAKQVEFGSKLGLSKESLERHFKNKQAK